LRRLSTDREDFKEENLDFPYETLQNEKFEDLMESARIIAFHSWTD
jgi:hypothetical protein